MENMFEGRSILVVDDSMSTLEVIRRNLVAAGCTVQTAKSVEDGVANIREAKFDLVITDLKMPGTSGMALVGYVTQNCNDTEVMMITGHPTIEGAVKAIKSGAREYLVKPFTKDELLGAAGRSLEKLRNRQVASRKLEELAKQDFGLIGNCHGMRRVRELIRKAAESDATVLISGDSGTGKELVARAIHYQSGRRSAPFVPVNCVAIPEPLMESELFGHIKGAFTGANESRAGFFQTADKGTIFLDEIGDTSPALQARLLRVLQEKEVCMVGSMKIGKVDVRTLAATNKDLSVLIKTGQFREDLFYRLNVIKISLPSLAERPDDILLLTRHFAEKFAKEYRKEVISFSDAVLAEFKAYNWPGNVRELENLVHRLVVVADEGQIDMPDLPQHMRSSINKRVYDLAGSINKTLEEAEWEHIVRVLESVDGNKTRAAEILNIDRKTLRKKLEHEKISDLG